MDNTGLDRVLGYNRANLFAALKASEKKNIAKKLLEFISKSFPDTHYRNPLRIGHSNNDLKVLQSHIDLLSLESLKLELDLEGFNGVPDEWLDLAEFLLKAAHGISYESGGCISDLARLIVFKISTLSGDKDFVRTFYKVPIRQLLRFFKKFKVTAIEKDEQ